MAKLKNTYRIWTAPEGQAVTVGNNRAITRETRGGNQVFVCRLRGSPVVVATPHGGNGTITIRLDVCGYLTTTTISAMRDFMGAFGVAGSASRAGNTLSARWYHDGAWHDRDSADGESMSFVADRFPVFA